MMNSHVKAAVAAAFALALSAFPASAATITGLFNTGTDGSNVALTPAGANGLVDNNYVIATSTTPGLDGTQPVTFKHPTYAAEDGDSRWISISGSGTPGSNTTTYRLSFDLTSYDAMTAVISGSWGVDNVGEIWLNGVSTGFALTGDFNTGNFTSLHAFSINDGFVSGINNLDFIVRDTGAPTALRVDDLTGTANLSGAIPEPATWAMMIGGFGLVGGAIRRRRGQAALA